MAANADGTIIIRTELDNKDVQKELVKLSRNIEKLQNRLNEQTGKQSGIKAELEAAKNEALKTDDAVRRLMADLAKEQQITSGTVSVSTQEFLDSQARQTQITAQLKEQEALLAKQDAAAEKLGNKYTKVTDDVIKTTAELKKAEARAGELAQKVTKAGDSSERMAKATEKARKKMDVFGKRLASVVRSALIFTVITQELSKFRDWMGRVIKTNDEATKAMAKLKGALLTMVQPIVEIIIPAFTRLINIVTKVVTAIARFIAMLTGKTIQQSASAAESLWNEAEALEGVGSAAKEAEKQLASFDEINKLSNTSQNGLGGAGSDTIAPDFSFEDAENKVDELSLAFERMGDAISRIANTEVFDIIKDFIVSLIKHSAAGTVNTVASSLAAVASACEAIDAVLDGDFGGALFKILEADLHVLDAILAFPKELQEAIAEFIANLSIPDWLKVILGITTETGVTTGNPGLIKILKWMGLLRDGIDEVKETKFGQWFKTEILGIEQDVESGTQHVEDEMVGMAGVTDEQMKVAGDAVSAFDAGASRGFGGAASSAQSAASVIRGAMQSVIDWVRNAIAALRDFLSAKSNVGGSGGIGGWGSYDSWAQSSALASAASYTMRNIPALAQGAVIPANREFLAVLGDQKNGTNIEAPLSTIEQALENVMRRRGGAGGGKITVILEMNKREFGRAVYECGNEETQRVGLSLTGGYKR